MQDKNVYYMSKELSMREREREARSITVRGPTLWNELSTHVKECTDVNKLKDY